MQPKQTPFFYGDPVPVNKFIGRHSEIRRITSRICSSGSSTALIGEPRAGKSSILKYIKAEENKVSLYDDWAERLIFVEVDGQNLERDVSPTKIWELILDRAKYKTDTIPSVAGAYRACRLNNWSAFALERFFNELNLSKHKIVLLLDEFGSFFDHPKLHSTDFYGRLRSLSTRFESLVLVLASRYPLEKLHKETLKLNPSGSPYFNYLAPLILKPFSDNEVEGLLKLAGRRFTKQEKQFIQNLSGGHPYLLQVAASALWEAYADNEKDTGARQKKVSDELYSEANDTLGASWDLWSPKTKIAFMIVALDEIPLLLPTRSFDMITLLKQLDDFEPEIRFLAEQGYIAPDNMLDSGWQVRIKAFNWWLANELRRALRSEESFEKWFTKQEWNGLLTRGEKDKFKDAVQKAYPLLQDLVKMFLKKP
jgi:hypothetical protein